MQSRFQNLLEYLQLSHYLNQRDFGKLKTLFDLDTNQWERWNKMFKAIVDVFGVEKYYIGSHPSPITLQILPKYLSLPTEKVDVETANDILDDIMTRIDRNDDGELNYIRYYQ